jgi:aryl-alcohol dehydrogenase-like predicted oxidoreductase
MFRNAQGLREVDGRPEILTKTCEDSLKRLQTDVIDLYYLHRWDKRVPIEDSIGAMSDMVKQGKVQTIGLSEVSADTLRKAHRVHPSVWFDGIFPMDTQSRDRVLAGLRQPLQLQPPFPVQAGPSL